jgi:hypothetical protein
MQGLPAIWAPVEVEHLEAPALSDSAGVEPYAIERDDRSWLR